MVFIWIFIYKYYYFYRQRIPSKYISVIFLMRHKEKTNFQIFLQDRVVKHFSKIFTLPLSYLYTLSSRVLAYIITTQYRTINVLITDIHELHILKTFEMADTRSNMQLADPNSKPRGGKSLRDLVDHSIVSHFYLPPGLEHYKLLWLDQFSGPSNINNNCENKNEMKFAIME